MLVCMCVVLGGIRRNVFVKTGELSQINRDLMNCELGTLSVLLKTRTLQPLDIRQININWNL